jgi:hypothetical protein
MGGMYEALNWRDRQTQGLMRLHQQQQMAEAQERQEAMAREQMDLRRQDQDARHAAMSQQSASQLAQSIRPYVEMFQQRSAMRRLPPDQQAAAQNFQRLRAATGDSALARHLAMPQRPSSGQFASPQEALRHVQELSQSLDLNLSPQQMNKWAAGLMMPGGVGPEGNRQVLGFTPTYEQRQQDSVARDMERRAWWSDDARFHRLERLYLDTLKWDSRWDPDEARMIEDMYNEARTTRNATSMPASRAQPTSTGEEPLVPTGPEGAGSAEPTDEDIDAYLDANPGATFDEFMAYWRGRE